MIRRPITILVCAAIVATTAACANRKKETQVAFEGVFFHAVATRSDDRRDIFSVTIPGVSRSLPGALEAARYQGTRYCIANYGTSRIAWITGPDQEVGTLPVVDDAIRFEGECEV